MFDYFANSEAELQYDLVNNYISSLSQSQLRNDIANELSFNNLKITETDFGGIILTLEDRATRRVPVVLQDSITFASGYHPVKPVVLKPDSVTVSGPITAVNNITEWVTDSLIILDVNKSASYPVTLAASPPEISLRPQLVEAVIEVEQLTEKSFFVPLVVRNAPDSLRYFPETVKVTCTVGLSDYNKISAEDFRPEIDLSAVSLSEGKNTVPIRIVKQSDYALSVQFTPKSAEFVIFRLNEPPKE